MSLKFYNPVKLKHANLFEYLCRGMSGPIARALAKTPVTPNQVTIFRCFIMAAGFYFFYQGGTVFLLLAALTILLWELFDCVDGDLATLTNQRSAKGAWLESVGDSIFGTVPGFLGFFVTLGIYREMGNVYPWIVFSLVAIGYFLFKTLLHADVPLSNDRTLKEQFVAQKSSPLGTAVHMAYYWVEFYLVFAAILYYPIKSLFGVNSLFLVMRVFAIMYNAFWLGIVYMQYRRFNNEKPT